MNIFRLILRNIIHYRWSWLLTLAGTTIGTAVLTGALITGDSVKESLHEMVRMRLGETRFALSAPDRYFRSALADEFANRYQMQVAPVLTLNGVLTNPEHGTSVNQASVHGIDARFLEFWSGGGSAFAMPGEGEAVISANLAGQLQLIPGDIIVVRIPETGFAPSNAPFSRDRTDMKAFRLKVSRIALDNEGARFTLQNHQAAPFNIFLSLPFLGKQTGLDGSANVLLVAGKDTKLTEDTLISRLRKTWKPEDAGLIWQETGQPFSLLASERIFIDDTLGRLIRRLMPTSQGVLTYFVNAVSSGTGETPYSFITAVAPGIMPVDPLPGQMVITEWMAEDLKVVQGDSLRLRFWVMGLNRTLEEAEAFFMVQDIVKTNIAGQFASLMPGFPGMRESGSCRDWETGAPVDLSKIREKDEEYWRDYKGTPKGWISLKDGESLWSNPFGHHTGFVFLSSPDSLIYRQLLQELDPRSIGFQFRSVFDLGIASAAQSTDFGELFLGLGGLIVIAGLLLSGMIFTLFLTNRRHEVQLFNAMGFPRRLILRVFLAEVLLVSGSGAVLGIIFSAGYSQLIVSALNSLWQNAVHTNSLRVFIRSGALVTGFLAGFFLNLLLFAVILRRFRLVSLPGWSDVLPERAPLVKNARSRRAGIAALTLITGSAAWIVFEISSGRFYPSLAFMSAGILLLLSGLAICYRLLIAGSNLWHVNHSGIITHALKNLRLHRRRNLTTITLLALGSFTVLVTGLNRKPSLSDHPDHSSGTGGFRWWLETTVAILPDLSTPQGRVKAGLGSSLPHEGIKFFSLPGVNGDDASCLNLNQVSAPGLLGVPATLFNQRQAFSWMNIADGIDREHPWLSLEQEPQNGVINGIADQTVITWGIRAQTGDTLIYTAENGQPLRIRLAGGLANSIFQGHLLVSDRILREYYPSSASVKTLLIDDPKADQDTVARWLESEWRDLGAVVTDNRQRLRSFGAVENTYLDIFILLGAFGLLLGITGAGVMILRNLRDRQAELRLYRALGFPGQYIRIMLLTEYTILILTSIVTGLSAAMAATLPSWFL